MRWPAPVRLDGVSRGERLSADLYERAWPLLGLLYAALSAGLLMGFSTLLSG